MTHPHDDQHPANRCTHCPRLLHATEHGRHACRICEDRARTQLGAMPGLYDQLGDRLTPGSTTTNSSPVSGATRTAPLPVALQPLNLRGPGGIVTELQGIEDAWRQALGWTVAPFRGNLRQTLDHVVPFLSNNLTWACDRYEDVAADLDTIGRLHGQAAGTVSGNRPRLIRVVCRALYDDGYECGAELRIDINRYAANCQSCGTTWGREEWVALYEATRAQAA